MGVIWYQSVTVTRSQFGAKVAGQNGPYYCHSPQWLISIWMSVDLKVPSSLSPTVTYRDCPFTPLDGYDMLCLAFVEPMAIFLPCQMALQLTITVPQWQTTHTTTILQVKFLIVYEIVSHHKPPIPRGLRLYLCELWRLKWSNYIYFSNWTWLQFPRECYTARWIVLCCHTTTCRGLWCNTPNS